MRLSSRAERWSLLAVALLVHSPAAAQVAGDGFVTADDGTRLYWQAIGERGDTVVFLHGGPGGRSSGRLPDLVELSRTHVVIGYDQRGGGRSPAADTLSLTIDAHLADLDAVRRHFGLERLTLLGHSWGSALAVLYAARHPDRVERLILNGPMPPAATPYVAERNAAIARAIRGLCSDELGAGAAQADLDACTRRPGMNARVYFADTTHIARVAGRGGVDPNANRITLRDLGEWDFRPAMDSVRAPTLVIEGRRTPVPMDQVEVWARTVPDARLLVIDGAGHGYAMIENPDAFFAAARSFLGGVWPPDARVFQADTQPRIDATRPLLHAVAGSAAGLWLGFIAGAQTRVGGGDDPGLLGALILGTAGSVLGSALGVHLGSGAEVPPSVALATSTVGILAGVGLGAVLGRVADEQGVVVGYAVGQGTVAAILSALIVNRSR